MTYCPSATFEKSDGQLTTNLITPVNEIESEPKDKKLSNFETFAALWKGYCVSTFLYLPGGFSMAGYVAAPILLILGGLLSTICVRKLVDVSYRRN